ncbi:MAG: glycosyltransferase family 39 protein, partial [Planctomycetota bacterium]|nr:glycosyltransferase family 39 protein [Planctomycetota bacterium]
MSEIANRAVAKARQETLALLLVAAMGAALFFPGLGERRFWYSYEARVAQVARQMLRASSLEAWLLPRLGDQDRLKKPPLAYWLAALAASLSGNVSHFTARLPNAGAAIGCLLLVFAWGNRLHGLAAGLVAAAALATCGLFWQQARSAGIEMPLLFFNLLALYAWWRYRQALLPAADKTAARRWLLLVYAALGLAFLQKGPVGPILVSLIVLGYLGLSGEWRRRGAGWRGHSIGLLLFAALALPWYALVMYCKPEAWAIWFRESAGRIEGFDHLRHPSAYFLWQLLGNGQPWV